jgi:hypothetical protein
MFRTRSIIKRLSNRNTRYLTEITGLSFEIRRKDVGKILIKNKGFFELSAIQDTGIDEKKKDKESKSNIVLSKSNPVSKKYLPFHSVDVSGVTTSFTGQYGHDRTEIYFVPVYNGKTTTMRMRTQSVTDWYNCHGTVPNGAYPLG